MPSALEKLFAKRAADKCGKHRCNNKNQCSCFSWAMERAAEAFALDLDALCKKHGITLATAGEEIELIPNEPNWSLHSSPLGGGWMIELIDKSR